ncbi:hypothetical protein ElyMa_000144100 [Elysia marginata]|uniref:G-protein coupled receptors family 1 profile domain-containing protein n=1 Tax=Elysia marginata TaxID=1093978 RepID=A0AAV4ES46_9GAST|nr:hypothetical protein ElyMa_000144100 [Elysia marginata]
MYSLAYAFTIPNTVQYWSYVLCFLFLTTVMVSLIVVWLWTILCAAGTRMGKGLVSLTALPTGPVWSCIATPPWVLPVCLYAVLAADVGPHQSCLLFLPPSGNSSSPKLSPLPPYV